ncbi:hypothetical protein [Pleomorphomonas oryzae]|uniref:hypothetical protein n=1 Tax=Pleomorphomonas oryzae TaxID=261934 RepID=UPI0004261008|nr:hypothetical protein [Pleomorphomonas oryzae]
MTPERFREIVEAYGAVPQRWPAKERAAAEALILRSSEARELLAHEAGLDRLLDAYRIVPPDRALTGAIIASAPSSRRLSWASLFRGLGIVGAGLAGAVAGAFLMTVYAPSIPTTIDDDDRPILTSFDVSVGEFDLGESQ